MEKVLQQKQAKGAKSNVCFCTGNLTVYIFFCYYAMYTTHV